MSKVVVIGASAGGVVALQTLVAALPASLPVPVLVVLHIGANPSVLPQLLSAAGSLPATHGHVGSVLESLNPASPAKYFKIQPWMSGHRSASDGQVT